MTARFSGLLLMLALAAGCGSSSTSPTTTTTAPGTPVSIVSGASTMTATAYNPNPLNVSVGTTVSWVNNDSTTHTSVADGGQWNSGNIAPGAFFSMTFTTAGTFTYHCAIHPNMVATVKVQ